MTIIRNIKNLFEQQQQYYFKSVRVCNFHSVNYIKYESNMVIEIKHCQ